MKISIDKIDLFEMTDTQKQVIANDIDADILDLDLKRRLKYILMHKYEQCFNRLKKEWEPKLASRGIESIPTNPDAFAQLVFNQNDYQDRKARELNNPQREVIIQEAVRAFSEFLDI